MSTVYHFEPRNKTQAIVQGLWDKRDILFLTGPAGTGKSHVALALALGDVFNKKTKKKIILARPITECGPKMGMLPGDVLDKIKPSFAVFKDIQEKMVFQLPEGIIEPSPLAYMRGKTFENAVVILDEAQNASYEELKMFLSRMGKNCKLVLNGDPEQSDIRPTQNKYDCDLDFVIDQLSEIKGIEIIEFTMTDNVRHPLVAAMMARLPGRRAMSLCASKGRP